MRWYILAALPPAILAFSSSVQSFRISSIILFDQADEILANALGAPLTRVDLAMTAQTGVVVDDDDDAPG